MASKIPDVSECRTYKVDTSADARLIVTLWFLPMCGPFKSLSIRFQMSVSKYHVSECSLRKYRVLFKHKEEPHILKHDVLTNYVKYFEKRKNFFDKKHMVAQAKLQEIWTLSLFSVKILLYKYIIRYIILLNRLFLCISIQNVTRQILSLSKNINDKIKIAQLRSKHLFFSQISF